MIVKDAVRIEQHTPDVGRVRHHQDDNLRTLGNRLQGVANRCTSLTDIRRQPALAIDKQLVPALDQVQRHRMTHDPEPDETDLHDPSYPPW